VEFKNETDRLLDMVQYAMNTGLINPDDELLEKLTKGERTENQYILDLATHSHALQYLEDDLREVYNSINLNTATGDALDNLGLLVGVARYTAQAPQVVVDLECEVELGQDLNIPAGTRVELRELESLYGDYVTAEDVTILANTRTNRVHCECTDLGVHPALPEGSVTGLEGVMVTATNSSRGTCGRNIEEDDDYRERVRSWNNKYLVGTRACITDYLNNYSGLDAFHLVPRYDGVGTLKVVCDTLPTLIEQISSDVYENCMLVTDFPPLCVLPESEVLHSLTLNVTKSDMVMSYTDDELRQMLWAQVTAFVEGGSSRMGLSREGLSIGADFNPSQLVSYLLSEFPECANIVCGEPDVISVPDDAKFHVENVEVIFDGV